MFGVSASVNLPLHHKVQKFSSGTGSPGWSQKKSRKTVVVVVVWKGCNWCIGTMSAFSAVHTVNVMASKCSVSRGGRSHLRLMLLPEDVGVNVHRS